jgi:CheY-like chemotaxis protein
MDCHEGRIALDAAFSPTVTVIDIGLPDMSGFDVAVGLHERFDRHPLTLIALSGYASRTYPEFCGRGGLEKIYMRPSVNRSPNRIAN